MVDLSIAMLIYQRVPIISSPATWLPLDAGGQPSDTGILKADGLPDLTVTFVCKDKAKEPGWGPKGAGKLEDDGNQQKLDFTTYILFLMISSYISYDGKCNLPLLLG